MLPRVLEVEVMDTEVEARDYDAMDFTEVNRAFVASFLAAWRPTDSVLDVCTGSARIPIELCRRHPRPAVVAVDLAEHMLALARRNVEAAGFAHRIAVERADAKHLPFPAHHFGAVLCNGSVHHVPHPVVCFSAFHRVCAPGGTIFVRGLLRPESEVELERILKAHAPGANDHQRQMFADSLRAALALDEVRELVGRLSYPAHTVQQTSDRHWTWSATRS
ncbi:MAG: class I SAM-dependent methyltransferase [Planctomycetes bacterium]|nr:class I SAM-dependent methyltransferase [Planctomycetota bacterium]